MVAAINDEKIRSFWSEHNLHGKIEFLGVVTQPVPDRTHLSVRYLCCPDLPAETVNWNAFRKKILGGLTGCRACSRKKSVEEWRREFAEAIERRAGLFKQWSIDRNIAGGLVLKTVCICGSPGERSVGHQSLEAVRRGYSLCRACATRQRSAARTLKPDEIKQTLAKLPGYPLINITAIRRDGRGHWMIDGTCLRNACGEPFSQIYGSIKNALAGGFTGCKKCALGFRSDQQRATPARVLSYAAKSGKPNCFKNIVISATEQGSWIEADCNVGDCDGKISTTWASVSAGLRGNGSTCCPKCALRNRESIGATRRELEDLATTYGFADKIKIVGTFMQEIGRKRENGEPAREKAAWLECPIHPEIGQFSKLTGDLMKCWRIHETNGCPRCGRTANGIRHRNDLDELKVFVKTAAIGPTLEVLDIWYKDGIGYALCRCLSQDCENIYPQQLGVIKSKLPRGSNGCPKCWASRSSVGEMMLFKLLSPLGPRQVGFTEEWVPRHIWPSGHMCPDALVGRSVLIEVHGLQHYKFIPHLHYNDPRRFELQQERDAWKRHGLPAQGYLYLEIDMRRVKDIADMAQELTTQARKVANDYPEHADVDMLWNIMELCDPAYTRLIGGQEHDLLDEYQGELALAVE